jgi:hypothetical protein
MQAADPYSIEVGDRIRLLDMPNDPDPVPAGTEGVVKMVTDIGFRQKKEIQLVVKWDNGRSLSCICPPDLVEIVSKRNEAGSSAEMD